MRARVIRILERSRRGDIGTRFLVISKVRKNREEVRTLRKLRT
jgi:hypothetical protein